MNKIQNLVRRYMAVANLAIAGLVLWQVNALASCVDNPNNCNVSGGGCMVNYGPWFWACSDNGANCCQYHCSSLTYTGSECMLGPCLYEALYTTVAPGTCGTKGFCAGWAPPP